MGIPEQTGQEDPPDDLHDVKGLLMTTLGKLARAFQLQHYYTAGTGALQLCLCHCLQHACCGDGTIAFLMGHSPLNDTGTKCLAVLPHVMQEEASSCP